MIFFVGLSKGLKKSLYLHLLNNVIVSFNLWMLRRNVDIFVFIANDECEPCYITIEFFETTNTI